MEATVVKETVSGNRVYKEMSDGRIFVEPLNKIPGTQYGTFVIIKGEVTDEKLTKAKEMLVDDVCRVIREIANERDDFFIIKERAEYTSVAHKFLLPTVEGDDGFGRFEENLIVE